MSPPAIAVPVTAADRAECGAVDVFRMLGEKWTLLVLALLATRPHGFNELDRAIEDISRRILTLTLRNLERDGFVTRAAGPSKVEYSLTAQGRSLLPVLAVVGEWAGEHGPGIAAARARYDYRATNDASSACTS